MNPIDKKIIDQEQTITDLRIEVQRLQIRLDKVLQEKDSLEEKIMLYLSRQYG